MAIDGVSFFERYASTVPGRGLCVFDPGTMIAGSMAMTAASGALGASGTIAGGDTAAAAGQMQQKAAQFRADQIRSNEGSDIGAAQRQMLDDQLKGKMASSTLEARGAAGGVNIGVGSPLSVEKGIASRSSYQSLMDLFNGQNKAVGDENTAKGEEFSGEVAEWAGEQAQDQSRTNALATIAGSGASMLKTYGAYKYPTTSGQASVRVG